MAVFTPVSREEARAFLADYAAGGLRDLRPIGTGTENTNYFLDCTRGAYVLTLVERTGPGALDYVVALLVHLAGKGLPCPAPLPRRDGGRIGRLAGRPALLLPRLPGAPVMAPQPVHCRAAGGLLAALHRAGEDFPRRRDNPFGLAWCRARAGEAAATLAPAERALLAAELDRQAAAGLEDLPGGVVHGDLFRDNVLFRQHGPSGVIDFYFASDGPWLVDLAIAANDWCVAGDGRDGAREAALLAGYQEGRRLTGAERDAWRDARRFAALRFWLSRLADRQRPRPGLLVRGKDPAEMGGLLRRLAGAGEARRPAAEGHGL